MPPSTARGFGPMLLLSHINDMIFETRRIATNGFDLSHSRICLNFSLFAEPVQELKRIIIGAQIFGSCFVLEKKGLSDSPSVSDLGGKT